MDTNLIAGIKWDVKEEPKNFKDRIDRRLDRFRGLRYPDYYKKCYEHLDHMLKTHAFLSGDEYKYVKELMDTCVVQFNMYAFHNARVNNPLTDQDLDRMDRFRERRTRGP
jgi:hypothetical protein